MKQQQRGVARRTDSPQNFKIALPEKKERMNKIQMFRYQSTPVLPSHRTLA